MVPHKRYYCSQCRWDSGESDLRRHYLYMVCKHRSCTDHMYRPCTDHTQTTCTDHVWTTHRPHVQTMYGPCTDHTQTTCTDHVRTMYRPHTDHMYRPCTDHVQTTHRPYTVLHVLKVLLYMYAVFHTFPNEHICICGILILKNSLLFVFRCT